MTTTASVRRYIRLEVAAVDMNSGPPDLEQRRWDDSTKHPTAPDGTLINFTHTLVGPFPEDHRGRLTTGWAALHARVRKAAESAAH